ARAKTVNRSAVHDQFLAAIIIDEPAQAVAQLRGFGFWKEQFPAALVANDHLRRVNLAQIFRRDQPLAVNHAVVQMQPDPVRQIPIVRVDLTGRAYIVDIAPFDDFYFGALPGVRAGVVRGFLGRSRAEAGRFHSERIEEAFLRELLPRTVRRRADGLAGG